jgi:uridine kinase
MIRISIEGKEYLLDKPMTLELIIKKYINIPNTIVLAAVNNRIRELNFVIAVDCSIKFIDLTSTHGQKTYKTSLSFLFIKAMKDLYPEVEVELCHTLSKGQYSVLKNIKDFNQEHIKRIEDYMMELVKADLPFVKKQLPIPEAMELFQRINRPEKIHLLKNITKEYVNVYDFDGYIDYFYNYLVPSTGYIKVFDIVPEEEGVVLLLPKKSNPLQISEYVYQPKLLKVFNETKAWSRIMGVGYVGDLNQMIVDGTYPELIRTCEALHENKIAKIADEIASKKKRIILIAGPSSSGKTSFSKRLSLQLKVNGLLPISISLDDYFIERDNLIPDEFGKRDFESIYALDIEYFNHDLKELLLGNEIDLPTYNFVTGKREYRGQKLRINAEQPIVIEGIHGLNPILTASVPEEDKFKIYVCPITQLNLDYHNRISSTDGRCLRRIVRDFQFRGKDARGTINMWPDVRKGEEKNIIPFTEEADATFNTTLVYELAVLKKYAVPLLKTIGEDEPEFIEANRLLRSLEYIRDIEIELDIPPTSIIREFIGNSRLLEC